MNRRYADHTQVPADRSKAEIEKILARYGAKGFLYAVEESRAAVIFQANNRRIRFVLPLPDLTEVSRTPKGRARKGRVAEEAHAQEVRRRWRALALSIKAKLETVESGIAEFETEFMPYVVMPNGKTVAENLKPQIAAAYETGKMPKLLEALS